MKRDPNIDPAHVGAILRLVDTMTEAMGSARRAAAALEVHPETIRRARTQKRLSHVVARQILAGYRRWKDGG